MSEPTLIVDNALCQHPGWREEYYGWRCTHCPSFIAFGCEPWLPDNETTTTDDDVR